MKLRMTFPNVLNRASETKDVDQIGLADLAQADLLLQQADRVELLDDDGISIKVLKDRHGPTS